MALQLEALFPTDRPVADILAELRAGAPNGELVAEHLQAVVEGQFALYERIGAVSPWIGYLARDTETRQLLGSCSFIGAPSSGSVEIAYFTFPPYEGSGVAAAMAEKLVAIAVSAGDPDLHAFTLPRKNASTRILQKLNFVHIGEATDEEAGLVWRWQRARQPTDC